MLYKVNLLYVKVIGIPCYFACEFLAKTVRLKSLLNIGMPPMGMGPRGAWAGGSGGGGGGGSAPLNYSGGSPGAYGAPPGSNGPPGPPTPIMPSPQDSSNSGK